MLVRALCASAIALSTVSMPIIMYLQLGNSGQGASPGERLLYSFILSIGTIVLCLVLIPISNQVYGDNKKKHKVSDYLKAIAFAHGVQFAFRLLLEIA